MLTGVKPLDFSNDSQLVHRTPKGKRVYGVTFLGEEVFVVRNNKSEVEVYDVNTLTEQRRLPVAKMSRPWDMTS